MGKCQERPRKTGWKKCMDYEVESVRPRARLKKTWTEIVDQECWIRQLHTEDSMDHSKWRTHTRTTISRPFFRDHPGEPVPEENFWTLWCKGRLTEADTPTIRLGATPSGLTSAHLHHPPHIFYRPDALLAAQPTASKHWRQLVNGEM